MTNTISIEAPELYQQKFEQQGVCVVIPTYNNAGSLAAVIEAVAQYCRQIIIVNDGATDDTANIINSFSFVQSISYKKNLGKGWALRRAFKYAFDMGYQYAITIDADGQHFANDLPQFLEKLKYNKNSIIIGARNMNQYSVPGGSSFGNKFSNFWFKVETGISLPDTQSGYRLYPLAAINKIKLLTYKYELEIEVLVKAAWQNIEIVSIPVKVYYAPKAARVTHFRPYKDFFRISILNTILVLVSFLFIKPRNLIRSVFLKNNFKQRLQKQLFSTTCSDRVKAISVAVGIFMGIIPLWGFQLIIAIFLAIFFKLHKALVIIAANISVPPMIPLIVYASFKAGAIWYGIHATEINFNKSISLASIKQNLQQYIIGSCTLAIIAAVFFGLLTFFILKLFSIKKGNHTIS